MPTLEYESDRSLKRRKAHAILVISLLLTISVGGTIGYVFWNDRDSISGRYRLWQLQQAAAAFVDPPGKVIYDEDPSETPKLLASGGYARIPYNGTLAGTDWNPVVRTLPHAFDPLRFPSIVCFLHELVLPDGERRIFLVRLDIDNEEELGQGRVLTFCAMPLDPSDLTTDESLITKAQVSGLGPGDHVRVLAGQVDPKDSSAFAVDFQINGRKQTVRGKTRDIRGTVELNLKK